MGIQESNSWQNPPHDILTEIFLRIFPIKSLLILRCVSQSWLRVISSPEFKNAHLKTSRKRLIYGSRAALHTLPLSPKSDDDPSADEVPFDFASDDEYRNGSIQIVGSCNGLVCTVSRGGGRLTVCNPSLRKYKHIHIRLPSKHRACGFGYDASNDDYKVVTNHPTMIWKCVATILKLYSFREDSWKTSNPILGLLSSWPYVCMNGAMHWKFYYGGEDSKAAWGVVAQSLTTGNCCSVGVPASADEFPPQMVMLGVWGKCLCVYFGNFGCMNVWVMKEYGVAESWTKVVNVPLFIGRKIHLEIVIRCIVIDAEDGGVLPYVICTNVVTYDESFVDPSLDVVVEVEQISGWRCKKKNNKIEK
ncbi:F-box/kelch-repeat protein At3g06240-like [Henckelia pumila]|uniref:F-box/kelch-repeat protein At3g06240-like n=1 Tax=Henckelia pumila TaxID=405737 RepID=UPI003C6E3603